MNDKRTVSMIDLALQKHDTPVGPLFVAVRHGRIKNASREIRRSAIWLSL